MTLEHRQFATMDEIVGLEFICTNKKCGVSLSIPVATKREIPHACPHCGQLWFQQESATDRALAELCTAVLTIVSESNLPGFRVRLELKSMVSNQMGAV
jgi:hypothetical protein